MHFPEWDTLWNDLRRIDEPTFIPSGAVAWCKRSWENFYSHSCDEPALQSLWQGRLASSCLDPQTSAAAHIVRMHAELAWYGSSTPYFRVWPDAAEILASVPSDFPTQAFALPFPAFVLRLPDDFNSFIDSTGRANHADSL